MIRQFEDGFESQPGAPRSGIPLGVSPFGIDPQVTDHSVEGPTVPGSIAMTQGKKQLWQSIGGRHGSLACRDHYLKQMFSCMRSEEHTSELQSLAYLVCRLLLEKKKKKQEN